MSTISFGEDPVHIGAPPTVKSLLAGITAALVFAAHGGESPPVQRPATSLPVSLFLASSAADNASRVADLRTHAGAIAGGPDDITQVSRVLKRALISVSERGVDACTEDASCHASAKAFEQVIPHTEFVVLPREKWILRENSDIFMQVAVVDTHDPSPGLKSDSIIAFHGSAVYNWWSIIRNGVASFSHTPLMSSGQAARGAGIYLSTNLGESAGYAPVKDVSRAEMRALGVPKKDLPYFTEYVKVVGVFEVPKEEVKAVNPSFLVDYTKFRAAEFVASSARLKMLLFIKSSSKGPYNALDKWSEHDSTILDAHPDAVDFKDKLHAIEDIGTHSVRDEVRAATHFGSTALPAHRDMVDILNTL